MAEPREVVAKSTELTLFDLLDRLENEEIQIPIEGLDIVCVPPNNCNDYLTDEDSGDEECPRLDNLPKAQLLSVVEIVSDVADNESLESSEKTHDINKNCRQKQQKKPKKDYQWVKSELDTEDFPFPEMSGCKNEPGKSALSYFRYFFNDEVVNLFVENTNKYSQQRNVQNVCTENDILLFIGVILVSGYVQVPRKDMYWQCDPDSFNPLISNSISRDRFRVMLQNIHVCDNTSLGKNDKFAKVRPLFDLLNKKFKEFAPHHQMHSVDESMVPYYGRHGAKQTIRDKPIRVGFKIWCGGLSNGYLVWLEPYQGANSYCSVYKDMGLGYSVVMTYVDVLPKNIRYQISFDNLFTTITLLQDLKTRGIQASGTIRENRIDKSCPITSSKDMKKHNRGSIEVATDKTSGVSLIRWKDNNVVTLGTNFDTVQPIKKVQRYSRTQHKSLLVDQPKAFLNYNKGMGGIDRADQNIALYRTSIRSKKWYFCLIAHLIDVCINNAWLLYNSEQKPIDHLTFRRKVASELLQSNTRINIRPGRHSTKRGTGVRFDGSEHYVASLEYNEVSGKKQQLRCRSCDKKATTKCNKCDVALHVDCFIPYHTKV
uniref:CSON012399 protein n=1 Tax=Culicoides sonorensis TaxID=179676 RepID=A0A336M992_CULSO